MSEKLTHSIQHEDLVLLNGAYQDLQVDIGMYQKLKDSGFENAPTLREEIGTKLRKQLQIEDLEDPVVVEEAFQMLGTILQMYAQSGNNFTICKKLGAEDSEMNGFVGFMQKLETELFDRLDIDELGESNE